MLVVTLSIYTNVLELFLEFLEILVRKTLKTNQFVSSAFHSTNNLIQFQINGLGVAILRVLNQENHQERDDGSSSIDDLTARSQRNEKSDRSVPKPE
jgi:hypothetical protein